MAKEPTELSGCLTPTTAGAESSSGNVFADLGFPNPVVERAKAQLVISIRQVLSERRLSKAKAGDLLGISESKVADLIVGRVAGYRLERMFRFLRTLGQEVAVSVDGDHQPLRVQPLHGHRGWHAEQCVPSSREHARRPQVRVGSRSG